MKRLLADFTKCFPGKEQYAASAVARLVLEQAVDPSDITLLIRKNQAVPMAAFQEANCVELANDPESASKEAESYLLDRFLTQTDAVELLVTSYEYRINSLALVPNQTACKTRAFRMTDTQELHPDSPQGWKFQSIASKEFAMKVAVEALRKAPSGSLDLTKLRGEMTKIHSCFGKVDGEPKHFISALISELEHTAVVSRSYPKPGLRNWDLPGHLLFRPDRFLSNVAGLGGGKRSGSFQVACRPKWTVFWS